jgi:hypothetical protein
MLQDCALPYGAPVEGVEEAGVGQPLDALRFGPEASCRARQQPALARIGRGANVRLDFAGMPSTSFRHGRKGRESMSELALLAHVRQDTDEIEDNSCVIAIAKDELRRASERDHPHAKDDSLARAVPEVLKHVSQDDHSRCDAGVPPHGVARRGAPLERSSRLLASACS